jgi:hypothetical protein
MDEMMRINARVMLALLMIQEGQVEDAYAVLSRLHAALPMPDDRNIRDACGSAVTNCERVH